MFKAMEKVHAGLKLVVYLLPVIFATITPLHTYAAQAQWTLEQDEKQIQLYSRSVAGSPFLEVKATILINAPIEKVAEAFGDGNGCSKWRAMCKSSEVLSIVSDTERYVYLVLDFPWPVSDRDMVIHSRTEIDRDAGTLTVYLESASSEHPVQDQVRAESSGLYRLKAINDHQVEFTYMMHMNPGGELSADIVNSRLTSSTLRDVEQLRQLAEQ